MTRRCCWFAAYGHMERGEPMSACQGKLRKCHLIPKRLIKLYGGDPWDERSWVWGCGGIVGNSGHHGAFDSSKRLRLRREAIPPGTDELAAELGLEWWMDRTYGSV